jgi:hypothetical protein
MLPLVTLTLHPFVIQVSNRMSIAICSRCIPSLLSVREGPFKMQMAGAQQRRAPAAPTRA